MNKFIIRIDPAYMDTVKEYSNIIFESQIFQGLIGIETELNIEQLKEKQYIHKVENDSIGTFYCDECYWRKYHDCHINKVGAEHCCNALVLEKLK